MSGTFRGPRLRLWLRLRLRLRFGLRLQLRRPRLHPASRSQPAQVDPLRPSHREADEVRIASNKVALEPLVGAIAVLLNVDWCARRERRVQEPASARELEGRIAHQRCQIGVPTLGVVGSGAPVAIRRRWICASGQECAHAAVVPRICGKVQRRGAHRAPASPATWIGTVPQQQPHHHHMPMPGGVAQRGVLIAVHAVAVRAVAVRARGRREQARALRCVAALGSLGQGCRRRGPLPNARHDARGRFTEAMALGEHRPERSVWLDRYVWALLTPARCANLPPPARASGQGGRGGRATSPPERAAARQ
jgi:hypothetical protein